MNESDCFMEEAGKDLPAIAGWEGSVSIFIGDVFHGHQSPVWSHIPNGMKEEMQTIKKVLETNSFWKFECKQNWNEEKYTSSLEYNWKQFPKTAFLRFLDLKCSLYIMLTFAVILKAIYSRVRSGDLMSHWADESGTFLPLDTITCSVPVEGCKMYSNGTKTVQEYCTNQSVSK